MRVFDRLKTYSCEIAGIALFSTCLFATLGPAYGISAALIGTIFFLLRPYIDDYKPWQKYLLGIAAIGALLPGDPLLPFVFACIIGFWYFLKDMKPESAPAAGMLVMGFFAALGGFIPAEAYATGTSGGLTDLLTRFKGLAADVKSVAPTIGYAAGLGFGGTGLMEVVKAKNGNGGDFGGGMKKVLIGGGLAGITAMLDMARKDMANK